ncbi:hypothetical protein E0D81_17455 [Lelliottia amnigena]|uniref:hypothetical protein n=1 Tax=Lelliottia amnigena TaxID=61646 RepID=UPI00103A12E1|nr:hypothetical protein [Lelliottia amnigena]TCD16936.1 hypothetical protein E0D81_17455 [Lelliottia amnigena]
MKALDQARQEIGKNPILEEQLKEEMLRLVNFIEKHPRVKYYPLTKIKQITKSERNDQILNIAIYFCGERIKILEPRYYYSLDSNKEIELTRNEFKYFLVHREKSLERDGEIISPVIKERLIMYFTTNINISSDSSDSDDWDIE